MALHGITDAHSFDGVVRANINASSSVTMHLPTTKFSESQHVISKGSSDWSLELYITHAA